MRVLDFILSIIFSVVGVFAYRYIPFLQSEIEKLKKDSTPQAKTDLKYRKFTLVMVYVLLVIIGVGILNMTVLPILEIVLGSAISSLEQFIQKYIGYFLLGGLGVYCWKQRKPKTIKKDEDDDSVVVEYAEQEAAELHKDIGELIYNGVVDASENTPFKRPRDADSIETGRETPYRMDGAMAIHQFSVDLAAPIEPSNEDYIVRQLQRHINQRGKRYPQLCRDGLAPIIYDIRPNGDFVIIEVILYSEKYKNKVEARRKARIARKQSVGDSYDRDF